MAFRYIFFFFLFALVSSSPLDDYVWRPDSHYTYEDLGIKLKGIGWTGHVLNMTSQKWLTDEDFSPESPVKSIWWHYVTIIIPDDLKHNHTGFLWISGGSNRDKPPTESDQDSILVGILAVSTGSVGVVLNQVPNQPIIFKGDPKQKRRSEDSIIAYTWDHFIRNTNEPDWLLRMPMTKAAVRTMDTAQDFTKKLLGIDIERFVVGGASKRGWTTWTTGAVDSKRVSGIIPIVMDALNFVENVHHMWKSLGGWTFAFDSYWEMNVTARLDSPETMQLASIVDPYSYRERLTMPKLMVSTTGDEFFQIDDSHYFWDKLQGEKHMLMIHNAEHSLITAIPLALKGASGFYNTILTESSRPKLDWIIDSIDGRIIAVTDTKPSKVVLRSADTFSTKYRDFRLITAYEPCPTIKVQGHCINPIIWSGRTIQETNPGSNKYVGILSAPSSGWRAFFLEFHFESDSHPMVFTTEVSVVPNTFPFEDCYSEGCRGTLL